MDGSADVSILVGALFFFPREGKIIKKSLQILGTQLIARRVFASGCTYGYGSLDEDAWMWACAYHSGFRLESLQNPGTAIVVRHSGNTWEQSQSQPQASQHRGPPDVNSLTDEVWLDTAKQPYRLVNVTGCYPGNWETNLCLKIASSCLHEQRSGSVPNEDFMHMPWCAEDSAYVHSGNCKAAELHIPSVAADAARGQQQLFASVPFHRWREQCNAQTNDAGTGWWPYLSVNGGHAYTSTPGALRLAGSDPGKGKWIDMAVLTSLFPPSAAPRSPLPHLWRKRVYSDGEHATLLQLQHLYVLACACAAPLTV